jgi:hypothetical protein
MGKERNIVPASGCRFPFVEKREIHGKIMEIVVIPE